MIPPLTLLDRRFHLSGMTRAVTLGLTMVMLAGTAGCVNVTAPDKPIEIDLNINVTQQVVYRLDSEAKSVIQQNPGIF